MNKILELKKAIYCLKNQLEDGGKNCDSITMVDFYKSEIHLLKDQNSFLKLEFQHKEIIVEKLLDLQKDQSEINCTINTIIVD